MARDYRTVNRNGWSELARCGNESSRPVSRAQLADAAKLLDAAQWIPWDEVQHVLCLAAAGGQQAPLFASLGRNVLSVDLCSEQLQLDREAGERYGFAIDCLEGDMLDLSPLYGCGFDLVYQAISACYVPDVRRLYHEVAGVLRPGGFYRVEHWNPIHLQLDRTQPWRAGGYHVSRPLQRGMPIEWSPSGADPASNTVCWHYMHSFADLVGGLCDAGLEIVHFAESVRDADLAAPPGCWTHLEAYLPSYFTIFARRRAL